MPAPNVRSAVSHVNKMGIVLVFPIKNAKEPPSLWSHFFPRREMRWEWSEDGDTSVAGLWHLRARLARSGEVVYTKWFGGRATVFSREVFGATLSLVSRLPDPLTGLSPESRRVLEALEEDSPQGTKRLRAVTEFDGRENEGAFNKATRPLWQRFLLVGAGEEEEGGFPSLSIGATKLLEEDLWDESKLLNDAAREQTIAKRLPRGSPFLTQLRKLERALTPRKDV